MPGNEFALASFMRCISCLLVEIDPCRVKPVSSFWRQVLTNSFPDMVIFSPHGHILKCFNMVLNIISFKNKSSHNYTPHIMNFMILQQAISSHYHFYYFLYNYLSSGIHFVVNLSQIIILLSLDNPTVNKPSGQIAMFCEGKKSTNCFIWLSGQFLKIDQLASIQIRVSSK